MGLSTRGEDELRAKPAICAHQDKLFSAWQELSHHLIASAALHEKSEEAECPRKAY